ncbi:MAG TPA: hypothetical protein PLY75_09480 [Gammaproteobacteria bacterium]|nr:hypothetical protein [Gammaproteobacteria bacterium]HPQ25151.1 hypothetical protein [Gammaproteobacteria bacterium]
MQQILIGNRQLKAPATIGQSSHVGIPQARDTIDDGDGLEKAITELKRTLIKPAVVRRNAVDQGILVHSGGDPPGPGRLIR